MERQRQALASGDERYLPARDKGPVRRFARDFVDSRFNIAEYFLPMAVIILVLSMIQVPQLQNAALLLWLTHDQTGTSWFPSDGPPWRGVRDQLAGWTGLP